MNLGTLFVVNPGPASLAENVSAEDMAVAARELRREKIRVIDVRAPHSETGLVSRSLGGTAPKLPEGLPPQVVVDRVLRAVEGGERDLPAEAFVSDAG